VLASSAALLAFMACIPAADADPMKKLELKIPGASDGGRSSGVVITSTPPDPRPMAEKGQWVFDLKFRQGDIFFLGVTRTELAAPQKTPRVMGRFALELFEGPTLIERVRFDFPGLADAQDAGWGAPPSFATHLTSRIGVTFPATKRGTRLELWDRATGSRWGLPWPPPEAIRSDAGAQQDAQDDGG
jgi:hypothetical protein